MNSSIMKAFLQGGAIMACLFGATLSHADVQSMTKIYNSPQTAPKTQRCKGNQNCNAFYALSKQWLSIPNNFTAYGDNIKNYAKAGDGYGLWKGASFKKQRSIDLSQAAEPIFYNAGGASAADERIFAQGLAVLIYLENKK
ncbi:hypothetical protein [Acinetobacter sp. ANC 3813]|uniref:hypothetical protein n=1 Tax=Acinetobacter sp. ANC 3813 TaxID=1977873 RepID=UPI000A34CD30|nr:hypothetical protein [Acinetobacter sp. ANC 3813]OTG92179.1 hypothetical protein B9T34_02270 [Acinetobacter sp. ANC 3813]